MSNWSKLDNPVVTLAGNPLAGRDLLRLWDLSGEELHLLLSTAQAQKAAPATALPYADKAVAIILEKPSLRTRVSFELAVQRLGAWPSLLVGPDSAFSRAESVQDTTLVLERFVDAIVLRTFAQSRLEEMARWARVPVVNALSDDFHPCQVLADLLTIYEHKGSLNAVKVAFLGDGNNMANSYLEAAALVGFQLALAVPAGYEPDPALVASSKERAAVSGATIELYHDPGQALAGADVVVTDTWASMGAESSRPQRLLDFAAFRVDEQSMRRASPSAIFLHCLPAHRGEEVTDAVMDAPYSAIYDEAENRLHVQQTLLSLLLAPITQP
jgi:ornithine carbamoyltransferase